MRAKQMLAARWIVYLITASSIDCGDGQMAVRRVLSVSVKLASLSYTLTIRSETCTSQTKDA